MPICRGSYIVFNIDFDVIEHRARKKSDPRLFWWSKYCNKIFLTSLLLVCAFFIHIKTCIASFSKSSGSYLYCDALTYVTGIGAVEQIINHICASEEIIPIPSSKLVTLLIATLQRASCHDQYDCEDVHINSWQATS